MNNKGFTLIELVLVIAILSILAINAIPKFFSFANSAENASRLATIGAVNEALALYKANDMLQNGGNGEYPILLDFNFDMNGLCSNGGCFNEVLQNPITDGSWTKIGSVEYRFNDGTNTHDYMYDFSLGSLTPF